MFYLFLVRWLLELLYIIYKLITIIWKLNILKRRNDIGGLLNITIGLYYDCYFYMFFSFKPCSIDVDFTISILKKTIPRELQLLINNKKSSRSETEARYFDSNCVMISMVFWCLFNFVKIS